MNHRTLEKELTHLEFIVARIGLNDPIPLAYWQARVAALTGAATLPTQRARVKKLSDALLALGQTSAALRVPPPALARRPRRTSAATASPAPSAYDLDQLQIVD
ncbi:hypothetical protein [Paraburkholderia phosphatilytica]|uniref:hypothetical protein n=1 Tax=Paraburkholderia phosphatilytica TaxID=2282883 RepID=UPI00197DA445|nr:hypothetical protein [Paraburkholderia phosphatilytica]